jgi:conjugal transfer pilus assembly protein TraK
MTVEALVSQHEPTRIRIADGQITDVVGNIHSGRCAPITGEPGVLAAAQPAGTTLPINANGELVVECHRTRGEIYIRPVGEGDKPINLFVASADATYTLLLRRADIPADTIVLRDPSASFARNRGEPTPQGTVREIKELLRALAASRPGPEWQPDIQVNQAHTRTLWPATQSTLLQRLSGRGLVGEHYRVRNTGENTLKLSEPTIAAVLEDVAGVAADRTTLPPGDSASVYILRRERP